MWFICAITTFVMWGVADLFYKSGNTDNDKYCHLKTGIMVGLVMGIHATIYLIVTRESINFIELLYYLPVSVCYILSMIIGYKGLKYIELSISSPIQNSSGVITSILLCLIFKLKLSSLQLIGMIIIFIGILSLSILEYIYDKDNRGNLIKRITVQAIIFPIIYCIIDGLGTFLDAICLDQLNIVSSTSALISYEYTFFIYGLILFIYLKYKGETFKIKNEKNRLSAAIFETFGQFTYVFALANHSEITIPIMESYAALSVLLSRIVLKEKLKLSQYVSIIIIFIGILVLGLSEVL